MEIRVLGTYWTKRKTYLNSCTYIKLISYFFGMGTGVSPSVLTSQLIQTITIPEYTHGEFVWDASVAVNKYDRLLGRIVSGLPDPAVGVDSSDLLADPASPATTVI